MTCILVRFPDGAPAEFGWIDMEGNSKVSTNAA